MNTNKKTKPSVPSVSSVAKPKITVSTLKGRYWVFSLYQQDSTLYYFTLGMCDNQIVFTEISIMSLKDEDADYTLSVHLDLLKMKYWKPSHFYTEFNLRITNSLIQGFLDSNSITHQRLAEFPEPIKSEIENLKLSYAHRMTVKAYSNFRVLHTLYHRFIDDSKNKDLPENVRLYAETMKGVIDEIKSQIEIPGGKENDKSNQ